MSSLPWSILRDMPGGPLIMSYRVFGLPDAWSTEQSGLDCHHRPGFFMKFQTPKAVSNLPGHRTPWHPRWVAIPSLTGVVHLLCEQHQLQEELCLTRQPALWLGCPICHLLPARIKLKQHLPLPSIHWSFCRLPKQSASSPTWQPFRKIFFPFGWPRDLQIKGVI